MTCTHGVSLMLPCPRCEADARAHELRVSEEQQRAADARIVEYHQAMYGPSPEDSWADEPEVDETGPHGAMCCCEKCDPVPEDVCRGCGAPHTWHGRTEADRYCFQCRYPERD